MRVVELDGDFVGKRLEIVVMLEEAADDVVQRRGSEKVLLFQAKFPSGMVIVVGVQALEMFSLESLSWHAPI